MFQFLIGEVVLHYMEPIIIMLQVFLDDFLEFQSLQGSLKEKLHYRSWRNNQRKME